MDLDSLDLDRLAALITILRDAEVSEFTLAGMTLKFPLTTPTPEADAPPMRPTVDRPNTTGPSGYVRLLGPNLPQWSKAE